MVLDSSSRAIASTFSSSRDLAQVIVAPSSFEPPDFDATPDRWCLLEEVERPTLQDDNVLLTVILAHATGIFLKGDVKHPGEWFANRYQVLRASKSNSKALSSRESLPVMPLLIHLGEGIHGTN